MILRYDIEVWYRVAIFLFPYFYVGFFTKLFFMAGNWCLILQEGRKRFNQKRWKLIWKTEVSWIQIFQFFVISLFQWELWKKYRNTSRRISLFRNKLPILFGGRYYKFNRNDLPLLQPWKNCRKNSDNDPLNQWFWIKLLTYFLQREETALVNHQSSARSVREDVPLAIILKWTSN